MTLIRPIYANDLFGNYTSDDNDDDSDICDNTDENTNKIEYNCNNADDDNYTCDNLDIKYYMINDVKINAMNNGYIKIHMSLIDEYGEKTYKIITNNIFFDVYIEAKNENENINIHLQELKCFDNTPQFINNKYTAMGFTSKPIPVWRLNINRNKLKYIYNFCISNGRVMFLNTELNDALPLVQKSIGVYVKILNNRQQNISYDQLMRPDDLELESRTSSYPCRKLSIDIEVFVPSTWRLFPEAREHGCEIIIIACTYQTNDEAYKTTVLFTDKLNRKINIQSNNKSTKRKFIKFTSERDMLEHFINMITPYNTDLITGWNIRNFDLKYIYDRCEKFYPELLGNFKFWTLNNTMISFRNITIKGQNVTLVNCFGLIILDLYDYNKVNVKAKSYKLKDIAKTYLQDDEQKIDMDYKNISKFYAEGTDEEFSLLLEYCSVDAEIVLDLMSVQKVWNNTVSMADICHVPLNYVINHGVMLRNTCMISQFINSYTDYLLPYKYEHPFVSYEGGFVNDPIAGFHTNPIFVLDFNSLYPTTMLAFNICTTTIVHIDQMQLTDDGRHNKAKNTDDDGNFQPQSLTELTHNTCDNLTISKTPYMKNVGFVSVENRRGVMPQILDNLLKTRKKIQSELKQTKCQQKRKQLDAQQLTYKLCANAIYGLLGCSFSPLYNPEVAASVTGFGRFLSFIKRQCITNYMKADGIIGRIIYGDTDSVMVEFQNRTLAETKDIANIYAKRITNDIGIYPIKTEYEKIFCPFLIQKKKHYIGVMYTNDIEKYDKIEYKGNEMVRSDNCTLTTTVMREIIQILFFFRNNNNNNNNINEKIIETGNCLRRILQPWSLIYMSYKNNKRHTIPKDILNDVISMAIFSKKLSKETYKNKLPHVAVYERMKNQKQYHVGDRIVYCIANTEFTDKIKPKNIIEMAYDSDEFLTSDSLYLSIHYYLDACVRKPLSRLYASLDVRFKEMIEDTILELFPPLPKNEKTSMKRKNSKEHDQRKNKKC